MADAGYSLAVDGEKQFLQSLKNIEASVKANKSEIRLLTAEYNSNSDGLDKLNQKSAVLVKSIEDQNKKVEIMAQRYSAAAAAYGEADSRTQNLRAAYMSAQTELVKLNDSLAKNEAAIESSADNTKQLNDALERIDSQLSVNASQIELLTARQDSNTKSSDLMRQKVASLTDSIKQQGEKTAIMRKQLEEAEKKYGTGSVEANKYTVALNKAEAETEKLNKELTTTKKQMNDVTKETSGLTKGLVSLGEQFGIKLPDGIKNATDKIDGFTVAGGLLATGLLALGKQLVQFSVDTSWVADDILTLSAATGMTTDTIQELRYAAGLIDVEFETIQGSIVKMTRYMEQANRGSTEAKDAFKSLRISVTDSNGQLKDANTLFYGIIDKLGRMKNETERNAISLKIFGRSAQDLNPLIVAGGSALKEFATQAHEVGYVMDEETLNKYGALNDELEKMTAAGDAAKNTLGTILLPMLTGLFETLSKMNPETLKTIVIIMSIIAGIVALVAAIKKVTDTTKTIKGFFDTMSTSMSKTTLIVLGIVAALIALGIIIAVIIGRGNELKQSFNTMGDAVGQVASTVNKAQTSSIPAYARGTNNHPGGLALVGDEGPEVVDLPAGSKVYPNGTGPTSGTVNNYYITIDAKNVKEFNDIVRIAEGQRQSTRMGFAR